MLATAKLRLPDDVVHAIALCIVRSRDSAAHRQTLLAAALVSRHWASVILPLFAHSLRFCRSPRSPSRKELLKRLENFIAAAAVHESRPSTLSNAIGGIRSLDLSGIEILIPHSTDGYFTTPRSWPKDSLDLEFLLSWTGGPMDVVGPPHPLVGGGNSVRCPDHLTSSLIRVFPNLHRLECLKLRSVDFAVVLCLIKLLPGTRSPLRKLEALQIHAPPSTADSKNAENLLSLIHADQELQSIVSKIEALAISTCGVMCPSCSSSSLTIARFFVPALSSKLESLLFGCDSSWSLTDDEVAGLARRCPNVKELLMLGQSPPFHSVRSMLTLCSQWRSLTSVYFSYYTEVNDAIVTTLATNCRGLRHLSLIVVTYDQITDRSIASICSHTRSLRSLLLHPGTRVSELALLALITAHSSSLETLQLPSSASERIVMTVLARCRMRQFSLAGAKGATTSSSISSIARLGNRLEALRLRVRGFKSEWAGLLVDKFSTLRSDCLVDVAAEGVNDETVNMVLQPRVSPVRLECVGFRLLPVPSS